MNRSGSSTPASTLRSVRTNFALCLTDAFFVADVKVVRSFAPTTPVCAAAESGALTFPAPERRKVERDDRRVGPCSHRRAQRHPGPPGERPEFRTSSPKHFLVLFSCAKLTENARTTGKQHPSPEELFRSCALVLASNAASEYAFISTFFGQHSTLEVGSTSSNSQFDGMRRRSSASASASASGLGSAIHERERSVDVDSDGGQTVGAARQPAAATPGLRRMASSVSGTTSLHSRAVQEEKVQRVVVDGLWKQVMEPALEYTRVRISRLTSSLVTTLRCQSTRLMQ